MMVKFDDSRNVQNTENKLEDYHQEKTFCGEFK